MFLGALGLVKRISPVSAQADSLLWKTVTIADSDFTIKSSFLISNLTKGIVPIQWYIYQHVQNSK